MAKVPFNQPFITEREEKYVLDALRSRRHCGNHTYCKKVRDFLVQRFHTEEVFLTPSGTAALEMGILLADLKPGDEVILPSYTFSSTANAFVLQNAKPVFAEIDPKTMNLDPTKVEALITPRTKMILPIHYAGIPCEMDALLAIAKKHNLVVMEDAAQAMGSSYKGEAAGTLGDLGAFSFHETKNITCGEGGALFVNRADWISRGHFIQEKGTDRSLVLRGVKSKYGWVDKGSSFLLSDILAAMLYGQLEQMDSITQMRATAWKAYRDLFGSYAKKNALNVPTVPAYVEQNFHAFWVLFGTAKESEQFLSLLKEDQVHAYIGYVPLHSSIYGKKFGYRAEDLPLTEDISQRIVRLPLYAELSGDALDHALNCMAKALKTIYG